MTRIESILLRVRDRLNDPDKERWSDPVLLRLLTDALRDIAVHTKFFYQQTILDLEYGQSIYVLPDNFYELKAIVYEGQELPVVSTNYMDYTFGVNWRKDTTEHRISHIIKEHQTANELQVYPRPFIESDLMSTSDSDYGIVASIDDYDIFGDFGIIGTVADSMWLDIDGLYGTVIAFEASVVTFSAIYNTQINDIETLSDELPIGPIFDTALKSYIIAHALLNDLDSENTNAGANELSLYSRELNRIVENSTSNSQPKDSFKSLYNGMG